MAIPVDTQKRCSVQNLPYLPQVLGQIGQNNQCKPKSDATECHSYSRQVVKMGVFQFVETIKVSQY